MLDSGRSRAGGVCSAASPQFLRRVLVVTIALVALGLPTGPNGPERSAMASESHWPRCEHPWPCGDGSEWPPGLEGPFAVGEMQRIRIPVGDGLELDGVVVHPILPAGVGAPVVLEATPYTGNAYIPPDSPRWSVQGTDPLEYWGVRELVEAGYAYANVNVLGTGGSDGCFDAQGPEDQRTLAAAVEWLADRPWSNGRVGMTGYSWSGGTPFVAALANPPSLKTIMPSAIMSNLYTFWTTPQGALTEAALTTVPSNWAAYVPLVSWMPPVQARPQDAGPGWAGRFPARMCSESVTFALDKYPSVVTDERIPEFYEPRMLIKRFPSIKTSVFISHGFLDAGHRWQDDDAWQALTGAPKRMLLGQWDHEFPPNASIASAGLGSKWSDVTTSWFDFWLKGIGAPARLGMVDYQDDAGRWSASTAWPPAEAEEETLYLVGGRLQGEPGGGALRFTSTQIGGEAAFPEGCEPGPKDTTGLVFMSDPMPNGALLSGNPVIRLSVSSDQRGGIFETGLFSYRGDYPCMTDMLMGNFGLRDQRWLSTGAVDLRYHGGELRGKDFPAGPQVVRLDLSNLSHRIAPGERLGLWFGRSIGASGQTSTHNSATITFHAGGVSGTQIRLPLVEGTVGGSQPVVEMPPRPFQAVHE